MHERLPSKHLRVELLAVHTEKERPSRATDLAERVGLDRALVAGAVGAAYAVEQAGQEVLVRFTAQSEAGAPANPSRV